MPKERVERDEEDLVRLYLTDIGQYPLLTKDDEVRLAKTRTIARSGASSVRVACPARSRFQSGTTAAMARVMRTKVVSS